MRSTVGSSPCRASSSAPSASSSPAAASSVPGWCLDRSGDGGAERLEAGLRRGAGAAPDRRRNRCPSAGRTAPAARATRRRARARRPAPRAAAAAPPSRRTGGAAGIGWAFGRQGLARGRLLGLGRDGLGERGRAHHQTDQRPHIERCRAQYPIHQAERRDLVAARRNTSAKPRAGSFVNEVNRLRPGPARPAAAAAPSRSSGIARQRRERRSRPGCRSWPARPAPDRPGKASAPMNRLIVKPMPHSMATP